MRPLFLLLALCPVARGATFVHTSSSVADPTFSGSGAVLVESRTTGADGRVHDTLAATDHAESQRTVTLASSGGTLTARSDRRLDSTASEWVVNNGTNLQFERTYQFGTTLDYSQTATTYGNLSFITNPKLGIGLISTRQISLTLDGPVAISLLLEASSGRSANNSTAIKGAEMDTAHFFNSLIIYGGGVDILNPVLIESLDGFFANPAGGFSSSGMARGVNYQLDARMTGGELGLDLRLQPEPGGGTVGVEVNFFYQGKSELSFPIAQNGTRTAIGSISGTVRESLTLRSIPEPGSAVLAILGSCALLRRRRTSPFSIS